MSRPPVTIEIAARPVALWRRFAAMFYDSLALFGIWFVAAGIVVGFNHVEAVHDQNPWFRAYLLALAYGYFGLCWHRGGQTLGMKSWHIRVVDAVTNAPLTWRQTVVRFAVGLISWLPAGLGYWWALIGPRQTWHDRASASRLIRV